MADMGDVVRTQDGFSTYDGFKMVNKKKGEKNAAK